MDSIESFNNDKAEMIRFKDFQQRIKDHLGNYKKDSLHISDNVVYQHGNKKIVYHYILPKDKKELNILESYCDQFLKSEYSKNVALHGLFHHLNSSQAMCINFFYPLIKENLLQKIINLLEIEGDINYNSCNICFEKTSEIEKNSARKTNFDFYIKLNSKIKIYFEIKYTEASFGKAKNNQKYNNIFNTTYLPLLKNNLAITEKYKSEYNFISNYQLMRNLVHIDKDSYVVFIYPKENKNIRTRALSASKEIIEHEWENHFILFTWESLVEQLIKSLGSNMLIDYYKHEFSNKYLKYR